MSPTSIDIREQGGDRAILTSTHLGLASQRACGAVQPTPQITTGIGHPPADTATERNNQHTARLETRERRQGERSGAAVVSSAHSVFSSGVFNEAARRCNRSAAG